MKEYKHTEIKKHPLRNCWMVWMPEIPSIPPYFGSKKECEKARVYAEQKAEEYLKARQRKRSYIFCLNGEFVTTKAFDKSEAYMNARLMGYNGSINDIRLHEE